MRASFERNKQKYTSEHFEEHSNDITRLNRKKVILVVPGTYMRSRNSYAVSNGHGCILVTVLGNVMAAIGLFHEVKYEWRLNDIGLSELLYHFEVGLTVARPRFHAVGRIWRRKKKESGKKQSSRRCPERCEPHCLMLCELL